MLCVVQQNGCGERRGRSSYGCSTAAPQGRHGCGHSAPHFWWTHVQQWGTMREQGEQKLCAPLKILLLLLTGQLREGRYRCTASVNVQGRWRARACVTWTTCQPPHTVGIQVRLWNVVGGEPKPSLGRFPAFLLWFHSSTYLNTSLFNGSI